MTDKNRDFSQIRVGTKFKTNLVKTAEYVVFRAQDGVVYTDDLVITREDWDRYGGYIVSQPEEPQGAVICEKCDGEGFLPNVLGLCATCKGQGQLYPEPEERSGADQASVRTREEIIDLASAHISRHHLPDCWDHVDDLVDEVIKLGDAAGYARRVAEEGGEATADDAAIKQTAGELLAWSKAMSRKNSEIDSQSATIAELMALKSELTGDLVAERAKVAALRKALAALVSEFGCTLELYDRNGPSLSCADGEFIHASAIYDRREALGHATNALAATGDE